MERKLNALADKLRGVFAAVTSPAAADIAVRVYAERGLVLIRPITIWPVIAGILALALTLNVSLGRQLNLKPNPDIEYVSPNNVEIVWQREIKPASGRPFYVTLNLHHSLTARDSASGKILWQQVLPTIAASSAPVLFEDKRQIFLTATTAIGAVYHLSATSGQILWMQNLSDRIEVSPLPIKNHVITVACADGRIYGLSQSDGHIEYMVSTGSSITALEPVADGTGEHIYAVADGRRVLALNARSGDLQWRRDLIATISDSPIVAAGTIIAPTIIGTDSKLWALDKSGEIRWINTFDRYNNLAAAEGFIAMTHGNVVTLIRAETGEPVHYWQLNASPADLSLTRDGDHVIVRTDQGLLVSATN